MGLLASYNNFIESDFLIRICLCIVCGTLVGLERQYRNKPVGLRTCVLVCLATQAFVHLGASLQTELADPARVLGQVVTGIGFLGAGTILTHKKNVSGITTAAVVWVLAAVGCYIGLGFYVEAIFLAIFTVAVLTGVRLVETVFQT